MASLAKSFFKKADLKLSLPHFSHKEISLALSFLTRLSTSLFNLLLSLISSTNKLISIIIVAVLQVLGFLPVLR